MNQDQHKTPEARTPNGRRQDRKYGGLVRDYNDNIKLVRESMRVMSMFNRRGETCFECHDSGLNDKGTSCQFCTAAVGDTVLIPGWSDHTYIVTGLGTDGMIEATRRPVSVKGETLKSSANGVVKVVFKLVSEDYAQGVRFYSDCYEIVLGHCRDEGLVEHYGDGVTCLPGGLDIQIIDGSEDF